MPGRCRLVLMECTPIDMTFYTHSTNALSRRSSARQGPRSRAAARCDRPPLARSARFPQQRGARPRSPARHRARSAGPPIGRACLPRATAGRGPRAWSRGTPASWRGLAPATRAARACPPSLASRADGAAPPRSEEIARRSAPAKGLASRSERRCPGQTSRASLVVELARHGATCAHDGASRGFQSSPSGRSAARLGGWRQGLPTAGRSIPAMLVAAAPDSRPASGSVAASGPETTCRRHAAGPCGMRPRYLWQTPASSWWRPAPSSSSARCPWASLASGSGTSHPSGTPCAPCRFAHGPRCADAAVRWPSGEREESAKPQDVSLWSLRQRG